MAHNGPVSIMSEPAGSCLGLAYCAAEALPVSFCSFRLHVDWSRADGPKSIPSLASRTCHIMTAESFIVVHANYSNLLLTRSTSHS
ncbi:hypothetical protein BO70DRAFT_88818 [Aspergillus heteromorphus CBS 117.55]|uniref:Uncharacterized protein n=1 Tax=Aspergillus heteromorphus CBS 117.55 TaxID=1448321 RepID=A0A317X0V8_9EURO|nr:uncharacterized protein BO70DRAFT_88818 [Aspergillus heteromorphus CBS 117.55]PWY91232.1 hypothetical protein BO70DRAFT_88818 [Aspergillus heteromorphus CBS 117.55]